MHMDITLTTPALLFPTVSLLMLALFAGWTAGGQCNYVIAMLLMIISLGISLRELQVSVGALDLLLMDMEEHEKVG